MNLESEAGEIRAIVGVSDCISSLPSPKCCRIIDISDGQIMEEGKPDQLLEERSEYYKHYDRKFKEDTYAFLCSDMNIL